MKKNNIEKSTRLWQKAKRLIPGGTQLLSKRVEMLLPEQWPAYFKKAKGAEITDLDGNKYIDMSLMGVGANILGYADSDVNQAVAKVVEDGNMSTLNSPEDVELAELLISIHPWAQMVRYARTGGEAMSVAVRIARAHARKDQIAFCGYHGWHDWYLSSNLKDKNTLTGHLLPGLDPNGVPKGLKNSALPFYYNHIEQLEELVSKNDIGVIVMEPVRHHEPENDFLQKVRKLADKIGAVLIFDEISSGFRQNLGGMHLVYGVTPDIAVFGKAMSNGYPMAAIIGKKEIMEAAQDSFISSTYWTERIGPAAAIATIKKLKQKKVGQHVERIGKTIGAGWLKLARKHDLKIKLGTPNVLINFSFEYENSQVLRTLFVQEMLKRGYLAGLTVYVSYCHKISSLDRYFKAVDEVFSIIAKSIEMKNTNDLLEGPVIQAGFHRLT